MASRNQRMHGRVEGAAAHCASPGCNEPGEFRAPLAPSDFNGPGAYRWLCLDHVREYNGAYNYFRAMSPEEIADAQSPYAGWEQSSRAFNTGGADPAPAWSDFRDPLDAIGARFRPRTPCGKTYRFDARERRALEILGLDDESDRTALRKRYSELVRRFHPDRNGGDRTFEVRLQQVIDAYQILKGAAAFA